MVRWHYQLNRHEFEQTLGDSGGQMLISNAVLHWHEAEILNKVISGLSRVGTR